MKKHRKWMALISTAAFLVFGASVSSFAAAGWQEENGTWVYLNKDGDYERDVWKKSGKQYYYLNSDGEMAVSSLIEYQGDQYYVDANGARVVNMWMAFPNEDGQCDEDVRTIYYRFGPTGRAYTNGKKTIGGKTYLFDEEGHMLSGWQTYGDKDDLYYLGLEDEGWAYTGWQYLEPREEDGKYDGEEWFYFRPGHGKAYRDTRKQINGRYYTFDENGIMCDGWVSVTASDSNGYGSASDSNAYYSASDGRQEVGWVYTYAPDDPEEQGDQYWYYLDKKGIPFNDQAKDSDSRISSRFSIAEEMDGESGFSKSGESRTGVAAKVIKGKTYLFDAEGRMLTGLYYLQGVACAGDSGYLGLVEFGKDRYTGAFYYFNEKEGSAQGQMMTGKQTVEFEWEKYYYCFRRDGRAYTQAIVDGILYDKTGRRMSAEDGTGYQLVLIKDGMKFTEEKTGNVYQNCIVIVNESGRLKKSGTVKIGNYRYTVENYIVIGEEKIE